MRKFKEQKYSKIYNKIINFIVINWGTWDVNGLHQVSNHSAGCGSRGYLVFNNELPTVNFGVSFISMENAQINYQMEVGKLSFDEVRK